MRKSSAGALQRGAALRLFPFASSFAVLKRIVFALVTMFMSSGSRGGMSAWNFRSVSLMSTNFCIHSPSRAGHRDVGVHLFLFGARSRQVKEEAFVAPIPSSQQRQCVPRGFFHLSVLCAAPIPGGPSRCCGLSGPSALSPIQRHEPVRACRCCSE